MQLPLINPLGAVHPGIDSPAYDVGEGQRDNVWFLAAPFGSVSRAIVVPPDKYLFFPLINTESSSLETEPFFAQTPQEQYSIARYFTDHVVNLFCEIDGVSIPDIGSYRFANPQIEFTAPSPWIFGENGGRGTSTGDGYFIFLKPLGSGQHILHFGGAFHFSKPADVFDLDFGLDMTYFVTVP